MLTDSRGMTAYIKSVPASRVPHCTGVCTNIWHPLVVDSSSVTTKVAGLQARFGTAPLAGGMHQLTVNGHRLYTYVVDKRPGQAYGAGFRTGDATGKVYIWSTVVVPSTAPASIQLGH